MNNLSRILLPLKRHYLLNALFSFFFISAATAESSEIDTDYKKIIQILSQTQEYETVRYNFTQEKTITLLSRPLISSGHILHDKTHGMYMEYREPVWTAYLIANNDIFEKLQQGGSYRKLNLARHAAISKVLESVITADILYLRDYFSLYFEQRTSGWTLKLKPRSYLSSSTLSTIILKGDNYLRSFELVESNGDRTFLKLTPANLAHSRMTLEETNYFAH